MPTSSGKTLVEVFSAEEKPKPLTNAERQRRRREAGRYPPMYATVDREVQAAAKRRAEADGVAIGEVVEAALRQYLGMR